MLENQSDAAAETEARLHIVRHVLVVAVEQVAQLAVEGEVTVDHVVDREAQV